MFYSETSFSPNSLYLIKLVVFKGYTSFVSGKKSILTNLAETQCFLIIKHFTLYLLKEILQNCLNEYYLLSMNLYTFKKC